MATAARAYHRVHLVLVLVLLLVLPPGPSLYTSPAHEFLMASLLERMSLSQGAAPAVGPVRTKSNRAAASGPYVRLPPPLPFFYPSHQLP